MPFFLSFLIAGAVSGVIIAFALDMRSPKQLLQGALGGLLTGLLIALLLPR
ncbi:MAG: hypothetical protein JSU81_00680 [Candidatus Coatesbacteria bacterium]|jgi:hypothetical protein|nr:MAG: hypothetical protein JSU81_00680 [Candidatus Coatesbacteria bacterium]